MTKKLEVDLNGYKPQLCAAILICAIFAITNSVYGYPHVGLQTGCYPCKTFMHRSWKYLVNTSCSGTPDDCGECLDGYSFVPQENQPSNNGCQRDSLRIVKPNQSIVVHSGDSVLLTCHFEEPVDCSWIDVKDGEAIQEYQLKYKAYTNGIPTKDCSVKVQAGYVPGTQRYGCKSTADTDSNNIITYSLVVLRDKCAFNRCPESENPIMVGEQIKGLTIPVGEPNVYIECYFNQSVDCMWSLGGLPLTIDKRITYINNQNGQQTRDCSIEIRQFREEEAGEWKCQSGHPENILSTAVSISAEKPPAVVTKDENNPVVWQQGSRVILKCRFDSKVFCQWASPSRSYYEKDTLISNEYNGGLRYVGYNDGNLTSDCSIEIDNYKEGLGQWKCSCIDCPSEASMLSVQLREPTDPKISVIYPGSILECSSEHGNPPPKLHWEMSWERRWESHTDVIPVDLETASKTIRFGQDSYTARISTKLSDVLPHLTPGRVLKCVAEHPAFNEPLIGTFDIHNYNLASGTFTCETSATQYIVTSIVTTALIIETVAVAIVCYFKFNCCNVNLKLAFFERKSSTKKSEKNPKQSKQEGASAEIDESVSNSNEKHPYSNLKLQEHIEDKIEIFENLAMH